LDDAEAGLILVLVFAAVDERLYVFCGPGNGLRIASLCPGSFPFLLARHPDDGEIVTGGHAANCAASEPVARYVESFHAVSCCDVVGCSHRPIVTYARACAKKVLRHTFDRHTLWH
jgi:hypothetical protein